MKTAIILFKADKDPDMFLSSSGKKLSNDGYTVLHSLRWDDYKIIEMKELINKANPDALYLFVDNGVTDLMVEIIRKFYYKDELGIHFSKEIRIEINYNSGAITIEYLLKEVSEKVKIPVAVLKMKTRKREIVEARQFYFKRAKLYTNSSLASIGALVGKDHATVIHGIGVVENVHEVNEKYQELFEGKKRIKQIQASKITPITTQTMDMLIGKSPRVVNMVSPYRDRSSEIIRPFSGYRVHSL